MSETSSHVLKRPPVHTLERALDLVFALERSGRPTRLAELSRATGIHKATAQRLLLVLQHRGMVCKEESGYHVGLAAVPLANAFFAANSLTKITLPVLQNLAAVTGETVSLYQRLEFTRVLVQRINGLNPLQYNLPIGQRLPMHLGGGRVFAAAMSEEEVTRLLEMAGEIRLASGQVWTRGQFLERLQQVRETGFDVAIEERAVGVGSVAAPVRLSTGTTLAALSITSRKNRLSADRILELSVEVRRAAQQISRMCSPVDLESFQLAA